MKMTNFERYIEQRNIRARVRGGEVMDPNQLTTAQANQLYHQLDAELSPENLCCDGELRGVELRRKAALLRDTVNELKQRGFAVPENVYEI